jgi:hypothetical protein
MERPNGVKEVLKVFTLIFFVIMFFIGLNSHNKHQSIYCASMFVSGIFIWYWGLFWAFPRNIKEWKLLFRYLGSAWPSCQISQRFMAFFHRVRHPFHTMDWCYGPSKPICKGDIVCHTCNQTILCRSYDWPSYKIWNKES